MGPDREQSWSGAGNLTTTSLPGVLLIAAGVAVNKWSLGQLFAADRQISRPSSIGLIVAVQATAVLVGLALMVKRPRLALPRPVVILLSLALAGAVGVGGWSSAVALRIYDPRRDLHETVRRMVDSEDLILSMTPEMSRLGRSARNLQLPDSASLVLFEDRITILDLAPAEPEPMRSLDTVGVQTRRWAIAAATRKSAAPEAGMWTPLFDQVDYFEHAKFFFIRGRFLTPDGREYEAFVGFKGLARMKAGELYFVNGKQTVRFRRLPGSKPEDKTAWRITDWRMDSLRTLETSELLFAEVLDDAVPDAAAKARARDSIQQRLIVRTFRDKSFQPPSRYFTPQSWDRHPGVSAADVDGDGLDDLYVMDQWGRNLLLRNRGDGRFEDIAARTGLDLENHCTSALFADFDNDGDPDLFVGRSLERSLYLVNEGGRFLDRSAEKVDEPLPYLVTSMSAADYNGDGLLDVYLSTYGASLLEEAVEHPEKMGNRPLGEFLRAEDAERLGAMMRSTPNIFRDAPGPPNVLLRNAGGGRFEVARETPELFLFRQTYQATWADWDGDGDPDLYCANDFGPNNMFRNDGGGRFTDVTEETGTADIGFGMGVSWGDYDNDGRQDLYVSNMYSKAGRRITAQIPGLDPTFAQMARGNSLFRNLPGRWAKVSGEEPPALEVEVADWSWGSQFADLDNDGYLDIYAPAGYYTAPPEVEIPRDL